MGSSTSMSLVKAAQIPMTLLASLGLNGDLYPQQTTLKNNTSYDYIVVGGGPAGCVVASRLVEDDKCGKNSVLLLEAGDDPPITALLPGLFYLLSQSYVDYNYTSTYNNYAASSQYNHTQITSGKMLGGSASLNFGIHLRGSPSNFDHWAKISGDNSWKYENILKYFIKSESLHDKEILEAHPQYHGTKGPTGLRREVHSDLDVYIKSFAELGNPHVLDLNSNTTVGFTQPQYTTYKNIRQTPALTYIRPVKDYSNLHYSKQTRVTKIIFEGNVAVAVEAIRNGKIYILKAKKEIIISAGTFGTPQLLMLSGIGPKDHLKAMNIVVKSNLPVGDNYIEPASTVVIHKTKKYLLPLTSPKTVDIFNPLQFPFAILVGSIALNKSKKKNPDYQSYCALVPHDSQTFPLVCSITFGLRKDICDKLQQEITSRDTFVCILVNHQVKSRGKIRLNSTDPFDKPKIITGFYTDKRDLKDMECYVNDFTKVSKSSFFKNEDAALVGLDVDECKHKKRGSPDFWKCYILSRTISIYHSCGTCPMGTVVDGNLKVKGFKKLRIVDTSIMPVSPRSDPNAAVLMVAEKAADMIKKDSC